MWEWICIFFFFSLHTSLSPQHCSDCGWIPPTIKPWALSELFPPHHASVSVKLAPNTVSHFSCQMIVTWPGSLTEWGITFPAGGCRIPSVPAQRQDLGVCAALAGAQLLHQRCSEATVEHTLTHTKKKKCLHRLITLPLFILTSVLAFLVICCPRGSTESPFLQRPSAHLATHLPIS